jgi:hypothetical protein
VGVLRPSGPSKSKADMYANTCALRAAGSATAG